MKVISMFSGCGGLDLGFIHAGHNIVWANDFDKHAVNTYRKNIGEHIILGDISTISTEEIPEGDIVIGGFPCQGFSIANTKRNKEDERNNLYLEILRVIQDKKPKFFLMENVPGILSLEGGLIFEMILNDMKNAGYEVKYSTLNSANYGVPQIRKRVIFIGVREDLDLEISFPEDLYSSDSSVDETRWRTVRDAIYDLPLDYDNNIPNHVGTKHKVKINGYIGNRATEWDKPSPTILGRGGGTGGPVIIPHPELHRRMTVRETARIQTFPDDFTFEGSVSAQYRQIGNAVPPLLAYHLGQLFTFNNQV